ncbi:MAG TPA: ferrous iron transport protein B [Caldilineaceae bacterium]|nr:ferrous iron transport protein B [Caldilineaceae bacterium]
MPCHSDLNTISADGTPIVLVGHPNVGKSVIFGALTNRYVAVSNYPGTTVEIARGALARDGHIRPVIDTPGIHSVVPFSDDERVTQEILCSHAPAIVLHVVDAKNLRRGLMLALELSEIGLPFVLNLNMADEAAARGIEVNVDKLSSLLGVPVVATVATRGIGFSALVGALEEARPGSYTVTYTEPIERAITAIEPHLPELRFNPRAAALMILMGDDAFLSRLAISAEQQAAIRRWREQAEQKIGSSLAYAINRRRLEAVDALVNAVVTRRPTAAPSPAGRLGQWMVHPFWGWGVLALVLYAVYLFVGVFAAGTLVDLLETRLFGEVINPWAVRAVQTVIPFPLVQEFLVGDYGLITMALTYGLAIVLPIVGAFFLAFSLLEDSGYLPRLAVMLDRLFRLMGLNGKAVLPMILGLGCDTMATMATRILETRKARLQVTLLLALAVPCSAQLGVILGLIAGLGVVATLIWSGVVIGTLIAVGYLSAQVLPGQRSDFILELPPLRRPALGNIIVKTAARLEWYLKEVVPIFAIGTAVLFGLDKLGWLAHLEQLLSPITVQWLGLPPEVTGAFLIGFLRRDYGATELFVLARSGALDPVQIVVSLVVITLFIPCIANYLMIVKEYGNRAALMVAAFVFPFAFLMGGLVNLLLRALSVPVG